MGGRAKKGNCGRAPEIRYSVNLSSEPWFRFKAVDTFRSVREHWTTCPGAESRTMSEPDHRDLFDRDRRALSIVRPQGALFDEPLGFRRHKHKDRAS